MTTFTLRPARESEDSAIKELIHAVGINPVGLDWKRFIVAADAQDRVVAMGQIKPHRGDVLELASIAVVPEHRGQGLARAVIEQLLKDSGRPLYLTCRSSLGHFYERFGFRALEYEEMPRYFQRISRLAGLVFLLASHDEKLLVMKLQ